MKEKFEVKIVRTKLGEELISFVYEYKNNIELKYPKLFYSTLLDTETDEAEYTLIDWLPKYAYGVSDITISLDDTLFVTYPSVEFGYLYLTQLMEELDPESDLAKQLTTTIAKILDSIGPEPKISSEIKPKLH